MSDDENEQKTPEITPNLGIQNVLQDPHSITPVFPKSALNLADTKLFKQLEMQSRIMRDAIRTPHALALSKALERQSEQWAGLTQMLVGMDSHFQALAGIQKGLTQRLRVLDGLLLPEVQHFSAVRGFVKLDLTFTGFRRRSPHDEDLSKAVTDVIGSWDGYNSSTDSELNAEQRQETYRERGADEGASFIPGLVIEAEAQEVVFDLNGKDHTLDLLRSIKQQIDLLAPQHSSEETRIAYTELIRAEKMLREMIDYALTRRHGDDWIKQHLERTMWEAWSRLREQDLQAGRPAGSLLGYSTLGELFHIVQRKKFWPDPFTDLFQHKETIIGDLRPLLVIRNPIMHGREIIAADIPIAVVSSLRIAAIYSAWRRRMRR